MSYSSLTKVLSERRASDPPALGSPKRASPPASASTERVKYTPGHLIETELPPRRPRSVWEEADDAGSIFHESSKSAILKVLDGARAVAEMMGPPLQPVPLAVPPSVL